MRTWTARSAVVLLLAAVLLAGYPLHAAAAEEIVIRAGHKWDELNNVHKALVKTAEAFSQRYPNIRVEVEAGWTEDKFRVGVASNNAPDVYIMFEAASWAVGGFIRPLDDLVEKHGVDPDSFVPATWDQNVWQGSVYALPVQVDPNFTLMWNKALFGEAGLDPETPPRTLTEFNAYFPKLTRVEADGTPRSIAMITWVLPGGNANTIYTWGWIFGGDWYDYVENKATAHHPANVAALEYLTDHWQRYEPVRAALVADVPPGLSRFRAGKEAMIFNTAGATINTIRLHPEMDFGVAPMINNPEAGVENAAWVGGWNAAIATSSDHPDEAFQFIKYITSDPEGVQLYAETGSWMVGNYKTPYFQELGRIPEWAPFVEIMVTTTRYRPAIPVLNEYSTQLSQAFPGILRREINPAAMLEELSALIDAHMAEYLGDQ